MKLKVLLLLMLIAFISLPAQAQNNNEKGNNKNKKEKIEKQDDQKNKVKGKDKKDEKKYSDERNDDDGYTNDDDDRFDTNDDDDGKEKKSKEKIKNKEKGKDKVKSNNGNAYGKHKYGLEGREFGQERARLAKLKNEETTRELTETVVVTKRKIPTLNERIQETRNILLGQKPVLSTEDYQAKTLKLEEAVRKMSTLEKLVLAAQSFENTN